MKKYVLQPGPDGLDPVMLDTDDPKVGANEVLIRVRAASLNYRDLLMRKGQSGSGGSEPVIPLSDGSGEVVEIGSAVNRFKVGDRVAGCFFSEWIDGRFDLRYHQAALGGSTDGMLTEMAVLPEEGVVKVPDCLSFEEAACLPCAGLTAWYALVERGELTAGESVLALGTGGVSIFALQLATAMGARVMITSSDDEKLKKAQTLGAIAGVNYKTHPDWDQEVQRLTEKRGVDHVVEVGGPGTLAKSMNCVAAGGHIALIGVLTGKGAPNASLFPLVTRNVRLNGIYVGHRMAFERLLAFIEEKGIRPVIDRCFAFDEALEAYAYLASGQHLGKVVIQGN